MVEGGGGGGGSGLVAVHDSAASWARGFSVRPRKWRRWGRGWTKKEEERAKERRRGGGGESDRGRAKEYERVGFAGSPLLIFPARLAASSFHFRSYTTLPPLSLSLPRLTTFLHLSPSSYSRSSFFLPSSTLSFLLSFARHASSSCPLANSRDIFPQFYIYIYTVMRMHAQSHGNIQRIIDACKRSFLHPLLSVRRPLTPWFSHPVLHPRRDRGGRSRVAASFPFNRRWPTRSREASIISGFFILFLEFDSARISKYSVPEWGGGCRGWRATFLLPPLLLLIRYVTAGNETIVWNVFSPMWILFFDSCSISIGILPLRGEGCLHIPLYTR